MATLQELMAQREALERQIEQTKKQERGEAIEKVRALMAEYGLSVSDLGGNRSAGKAKKNQVGRQQGGSEVSKCLDRRIVERPGSAAALAEGRAGQRPQARRFRGLAAASSAPVARRPNGEVG